MNHTASRKEIMTELLLFPLDLFILYMSIFCFATHISLFVFNSDLPGWYRYTLPPIFLCVAVLLAYKILFAVSKARCEKMWTYIEPMFFVCFALVGASGCFMLSRLIRPSFFYLRYPTLLVLCAIIIAFTIVWFLPKRLRWRKVPLFFCILVLFGFVPLLLVRAYVTEADLLPDTPPGVRVVHRIPDPLKPDDSGSRSLLWNSMALGCKKFLGMRLALHQYGHIVGLSEKEDFIYIEDFNYRGMMGQVLKIRLDDFSVVAGFKSRGTTFGDMLEDETSDTVAIPFFYTNDLCYLKASTLELVDCIDVGTTALWNILKLPDGTLALTTETGRVVIVDPQRRKTLRTILIPGQVAKISLDETGRFVVICSLNGYNPIVFDLENMEVSRKRYASFASWGVALDSERNRVFLSRILQGDLLVLEYDSLKTIERIPLEGGLRTVVYLRGRNIVVVGNHFTGRIYFIDGSSYRVINTLWAGTRIRDMRYSALRDRLYVSTGTRLLEIDVRSYCSGSHTPG